MTNGTYISLGGSSSRLSTRVCHLSFMSVAVTVSEGSIHSIHLCERMEYTHTYPSNGQHGSAHAHYCLDLLDTIEQRLRCGLDLSDLPVTQRGTEFQRKVWRHIRSIPRGLVASYAEVASAIGHPRAVRAVANACACNTVALAIPCHRVVRSDGALGGFRWGITLKERLLFIEHKSETGLTDE
jgi:O-6-methylguanine DNA methyltransferase